MNEQTLSRLQARIERGTTVHGIGGVLIFGWRSAPTGQVLWPAQDDAAKGQASQEVRNAGVTFQTESGNEIAICWNNPMLFHVSKDCYHQFLLSRRKTLGNAVAHGVTSASET